jgi:predicted nucleic-acid-binding protein
MLGLDTNVIARIVLADDPVQTAQALAAIAQAQANGETVVLGLATVLELEWVLRSRAKLDKPQVLLVFKRLLETQDLQIDHEQVLEQAIYVYEHGSADFPECLFLAQYQRMGCRAMLTFDAKAARLGGAELVGKA